MNNNQGIEITRQTVLNFRFFDAAAMTATAKDLSLVFSVRELLSLRDHFRLRELRDPTVGELQFLSTLYAQQRLQASHTEITELSGTNAENRSLADIQRMHEALGGGPLTLRKMMCTAGRYLERSGILPYHKTLICGATAEMAARAEGQDPTLALDIGNISAMLPPAAKSSSPHAQALLLLSPANNSPLPSEIARFLARYRACGVYPLAAAFDEGALPHLLACGRGFFLDLAPFAHRFNARTPASALSIGKDTVLLCTPVELIPRLLAEGAPVTPCGALNGNRTVQIANGPELLLSLSLDIFSLLDRGGSLTLHPKPCEEQRLGQGITASDSLLLGGVATRGGCAASLLTLIGELLARGADGNRLTLTCAAELPARPQSDDWAAVSVAVLELHRVTAELALSCVSPALHQHGHTVAALTVFACAERQASPADGFLQDWQAAAASRDYATLRHLLRRGARD